MYTGGTLLANATPNGSGIASFDPPALGLPTSLPNIPGTYYVYAIANPAPADATCRPFQLIQVVVTSVASISLSSPASTTNQTVCINSPIVNITYTIGGAATGANVTGLPAGINVVVSGTTVTLSGSPSVSGVFNYTITTTGGNCGFPSLTGTITVNVGGTLVLTSAPATTNQTVCINTTITPITYTFGGTATGATITGLPTNVTATITGNTITISGTPTVTGTYNYTVTTTGSGCGAPSLTGTIIVNPLATLSLTSSLATTNQTVCENTSITNITYTFGGSATGATVTGLPGGVAATVTGSTVTISGTPTLAGIYNYTITTTGGACGTPSLTGTITVSPTATLVLTSAAATTNQTVCVNSAITAITYTFGGSATGATVTGLPTNVTATISGTTILISGTPTIAGTYNYTVTTTGGLCGTPSLTGTIIVSPIATLTLTSPVATTNQTVCATTAITNITYTFGGSATGATVTGLPTNVTATVTGTTVTISGTPTIAGTYNYTVTTTGGSCGAPSLTGTIVVNPTATLVLTSATATTNQTVCANASVTTITYTFGGTATGATVTGLPGSVTATVTGTTVTISGTPTIAGTYNYTVTTTGGLCGTPSLTGTIVVNPSATLVLTSTTATTNQTVCANASIATITYTLGGTATGATVTGLPTNVTATVTGTTVTISGTPTIAGTYNYTVTTTGGLCGTPSLTGSITVISAPVISTPTPYQVCDENTDGVSCLFNLHTKDSEITTVSGLTITYHLTLTDAQTGFNPQTQNPYCNINSAFTQVLYVRVIDPLAPACYSTTTLQLIVNPKPLVNPNVTNYELCDINTPGDGFEQFNLPTKTTQIINGQSSMVVSYYLTQANATNQVSPLPSLYTNVVANTQTIWYNIKNTVTGCTSVGPLNLVVNPLPVITVNSPTVCQGAAATVTATPALAGSYSYVWTVPNSVLNPGNVANFTTTVAGVYSVIATNSVTGCVGASASGTVTLITAPTISTPSNYIVCDDNNDGVSCMFLLGSKDVEISTVPGIQISYHLTPTDAQTGSNALPKNSPYCNITNPQTIYIRVFDPAAPACSSYTTMQLIVNPKPIAHLPNDYHLCDANASLSITEATFNLTTVVTPQVVGNQSAANYTVTYYTSLANAQAPSNALSAASALAYTTASTTLWIRIQNNTTGCYDITTVNLVVDPLPTALSFYPQYELCETVAPLGIETFNLSSQVPSILNGQTGVSVTFYPTLAQAQAGTGAISTPNGYTNVIAYAQTLGIRITNTATNCYAIATMDLVVNPKPAPIAPTQPYTVCDNDQDGFGQFDLNTLTPGFLSGATGVYTISYYLTQTDANTLTNPINLSQPFLNNDAFIQFIWVRAEDPITHCYTVIKIELNVDPAPMMPVLPAIALCDQDVNTQDGCTQFNLNSQTAAVLAAQVSAPSNYTVTYYTTQANATTTPNGTGAIINTATYTGCTGQTIWVRVQNNSTGCFTVGSFLLQVNAPLVLTTPTLLSLCDDDAQPNNLYTTFNMSGFIGTIPGHTIAFYLDANHNQLIANPAAFVNTIAATQTVFIVVTDDITGCQSFRTLTIQVLPIPTPKTNPPALAPKCDVTNPGDGVEVFDLTANALYIANNDPNVTLHYFPSQIDAINYTNEITAPTTALVGQNVWIRVESNFFIDVNNEHCYVLVEQALTVNPLPTLVQPIADYQECDDDTDGFTLFNLNSQAAVLLASNATPLSNYSLTFYTDAALTNAIASPGSYTNLSNPQTIYVVATNSTTGCKSLAGQFNIIVNPKPLATAPANFATCDTDGTNDGLFAMPLDTLVPAILAGQSPAAYTVTFYNNLVDATAGNNAISNLAGYMTYTHTIWVRVQNNTTGCFRLVSFDALVELVPEPTIVTDNDVHVICVDFLTDVVVRPLLLQFQNPIAGTYTYQWFEASNPTTVLGTGPTYLVDTPATNGATRNYTLVLTSTTALGCTTTSASFAVLQSGQAVVTPAASAGYTVSNAFSENQTITVTVTGYGTYEYSLDDGPRQTSNVFENVTIGSNGSTTGVSAHYITVWDSEGGIANSCDPLVLSNVQTIDYPHYFTPNGDGIHDTWNIVGLSGQPMAKIYIFDRSGKLIKQISPQGQGWDGTYNGNLLPSTDYWFTVDYNEADALKQFKAHFSLKR